MKDKKGALLPFSLLHAFKFGLGAVVTVLLISVVWQFFGPQEKAEASTKKAMEDLVLKVRDIEAGQEVIAYGYLDKDSEIRTFNSGVRINEVVKKCGSRSNSCICACKGNDCEKVMECKAFPEKTIRTITVSDQDTFEAEKSFTVRMTLNGDNLQISKIN